MRPTIVPVATGLVALLAAACRTSSPTPTCRHPIVPAPAPISRGTLKERSVFVDLAFYDMRNLKVSVLPNSEGLQAGQRVLTEAEARNLQQRLANAESVRIVQSPKMLVTSGTEGTVFIGESTGNRHDDWIGLQAGILPRVVDEGLAVAVERLRVERRERELQSPQVLTASGIRLESGQSIVLAPEGSLRAASGGFMVLMTVRVLPAS